MLWGSKEYRSKKSDWNTKAEPKYNHAEGNNEYNPYGPNGGNNNF
jgi:hypothetical protein